MQMKNLDSESTESGFISYTYFAGTVRVDL